MIVFFRPEAPFDLLRSVGVPGVLVWTGLTVVARLLQGEATVVPMASMGHAIKRSEVFWIGWIRTFANQILPISGIAAYAHAMRSRTAISWSELVALAGPQFVLAATALSVIGIVAVASNPAMHAPDGAVLALIYGALGVFSIAITRGSNWIVGLLPSFIRGRAAQASEALQKIASSPTRVLQLIAYHAGVVCLRGVRIWLLFVAAGVSLSWNEALLLIAIAESTLLIQITPGGLGIREGAIIGGAALVGIPTDVATGVAILDRILVISLIALMTPPSIAALNSSSTD